MNLSSGRSLLALLAGIALLAVLLISTPDISLGQKGGSIPPISGGSGGGGFDEPPPVFEIVDPTPLLLSGYAWSGGVGWISFGNGDYNSVTNGVYLGAPTGAVGSQTRSLGNQAGDGPGYAWSSNIGWIKFDKNIANLLATGELAPPVGDSDYGARLSVATGQFTGWARACAVFASGCAGSLKPDSQRGGWDGWIRMGGDNYTSLVDSGVAPTKFATTAYSWGGDVIGWIKWCSTQTPSYCVRFGGLGATCSVNPNQLTFQSDTDGTSHYATWRVDATGVPTFPCPGDPLSTCVAQHTYEWDIDGVGVGSARANSASYEPPQALYQCPADNGLEKQANFTVTNSNGVSAYCSLTKTVTCIPPSEGTPGDLGDPDVPVIRITSQPLASPAISSTVSFPNNGTAEDGDLEVVLENATSVPSPAVLLGGSLAGSVGCRLALESNPVTSSTPSSEFKTCNDDISLTLAPGEEAIFNIRVGSNPPHSLNLYNPYQITVRGTPTSCPEGMTCGPKTKSFLFDYAVGSVTPI